MVAPQAGAAHGNAFWPCCGTVGYENSKYHSESPGNPRTYLDNNAGVWVWGCRKGACGMCCVAILALTPERCCATVLGMHRLPRPIRGVAAS